MKRFRLEYLIHYLQIDWLHVFHNLYRRKKLKYHKFIVKGNEE